ncbi:MAG TPA: L,D-transpeptidase family protein [Pusillimonas sp.]|uniref:L,D-transpeptidase family protein n=1 Tax=Pusillimonas sp. TaxID=3040095 RepID=UPI002C174752|nr:L,D-transpeptidase family protein [Pusillimonas sp.]HUH88743.1 L,D-transpeptidase family protein [Pusillimonas sp.]
MKKPFLYMVLAGVLSGYAAFASGQAHSNAVAPVPELETPAATSGLGSVPAELMLPMPSWFENGRPGEDARAALATLADAQDQGLRPQDYRAVELAQAFEQASRSNSDPQSLAHLDAELTHALERYLTELNQGRLTPEQLKHDFKAPSLNRFDARAYVLRARQEGRLAQALQSAQPKVPMYESVRSAMNTYRAMGDHRAWRTPLAPLPGRSLKSGQPYQGLAVLAARLEAVGDLPAGVVAADHYDSVLEEGVRRFQARHGLDVDGVVGPGTVAQLEITPAQRVEQMALTLERLRWTPLMHAPRMIVVNVPEFMLRAYELHEGQVKLDLEMRVVVGRALDTRTPIFLEDMRFIEFSPYWNVPRSIARAETLPRLRRDPGYFTRQGFEFVTREGTVVNTLSGDAIDAVQRGEWRIRQRPGPRNALGDIKFIFPNDQNIFLHHTPAPELFSRARRDFSHGCIRVEAPVQLAQFVLRNQPEWTTQRIEAAMQGGKSYTLRLAQTIPVLIAYSTVVVKDSGTVYFFPDIYQQDARLEQALHSARRAP